jgi:hypothetical protein
MYRETWKRQLNWMLKDEISVTCRRVGFQEQGTILCTDKKRREIDKKLKRFKEE